MRRRQSYKVEIAFKFFAIVDIVFTILGRVCDVFGVEEGLKKRGLWKKITPVVAFFSANWMIFLVIAILFLVLWFLFKLKNQRKKEQDEANNISWYDAHNRNTKYIDENNSLVKIVEFLRNRTERFSWWSLSAVAGMGKTRTVLEALRNPEFVNTDVEWLESIYQYEEQSLFKLVDDMLVSSNKRHIIIAEDAQINLSNIGKIIVYIHQKIQEGIGGHSFRLLLLIRLDERDNIEGRYHQLFSADPAVIKRYKYGKIIEELRIEKYSDEEIISISESFIAQTYKKRTNKKMPKEEILSKAKETLRVLKKETMDPVHCRPLFALFIADTILQGKDPSNWDKKDILDYITEERFSDLLNKEISGIQRIRNVHLYEKIESILCLANLIQGIPFNELGEIRKKVDEDIKASHTGLSDAEELFEDLQLIDENRIIRMQVPDLLSEYFVLKKLVFDKNAKRIRWITLEIKDRFEEAFGFRLKVVQDFSYLYRQKEKNDEDLENKVRFFYDTFFYSCTNEQIEEILEMLRKIAPKPDGEYDYIMDAITSRMLIEKDNELLMKYGSFLADSFDNGTAIDKKWYLGYLETIAKGLKNDIFMRAYCGELRNMTAMDDLGIKEKTAYFLELQSIRTSEEYNEDLVIIRRYYESLYYMLINYRYDSSERNKYFNELEGASKNKRFAKDPTIISVYCDGLAALTEYDNEYREKQKYLAKLKEINKRKEFSKERDIILPYTLGLANMIYYVSDIKEKYHYYDTLTEICERKEYAQDFEFILNNCRALLNMTEVAQDNEERRKYFFKLKKLCQRKKFAHNREIMLEYCKGLFNMTVLDKEYYDYYMREFRRVFCDKNLLKYSLEKIPQLSIIRNRLIASYGM